MDDLAQDTPVGGKVVGVWTLRFHNLPGHDGFHDEKVEIKEALVQQRPGDSAQMGQDPRVGLAPAGVQFVYRDGRQRLVPWTSVLEALYQPCRDDEQVRWLG